MKCENCIAYKCEDEDTTYGESNVRGRIVRNRKGVEIRCDSIPIRECPILKAIIRGKSPAEAFSENVL